MTKVTEIELASGRPFIADRRSDRVAALDARNRLVSVDGSRVETLVENAADRAWAFDDKGELMGLDREGTLTATSGGVVARLPLDGGQVDVTSGIDIRGDSIAFTVDHADGFVILIASIEREATTELRAAEEYIGQARWSPDGTKLAFVGPRYETIEIVDSAGAPIATIRPQSSQLSKRQMGPRWVDDRTVMFANAVPAIVFADASTGAVGNLVAYDPETELFPALPISR